MSKITNLIWAFSGSVLFLYSCSKEVKNTAGHEDSTRSGKVNSLNINRKSGAEPSYKKYSGAWFEIDYPAGFSVKNSQKSLTKKEGFDSAIFTSGDGKVQFYVFSPQWSGVPADIFPNSGIKGVLKYGDGVGDESNEVPENVQHAHFILDGYSFYCMDNSFNHEFDFNEGISVVVMTNDQEETDHLWNSLSADGGRESMCGWLKDKFGVSWQIVPKKLLALMNGEDHMKGIKVMEAMMNMKKIIISDLENAYNAS